MRVIVCGSREWRDPNVPRRVIEDWLFDLVATSGQYPIIVHGGARGVDRIAAQEAEKAGLLVEPHFPDYERYGRKLAPLKRNEHMAKLGADLCKAIRNGKTSGTGHMIGEARKHGIPVDIVELVQ